MSKQVISKDDFPVAVKEIKLAILQARAKASNVEAVIKGLSNR